MICILYNMGPQQRQNRATSFYLNKQSGTQFYDRKPMRSIILHKNFQEDKYIQGDFQDFQEGF